jgi:non-ribosomal peptide synthetase component F
LPLDYQRSNISSYEGDEIHFIVSKELLSKLKSLVRQKQGGATLYSLLLTLFFVLLNAYSNQRDICIGTLVSNRNIIGTDSLIGFFVNTLAIRVQMSYDMSFQQL